MFQLAELLFKGLGHLGRPFLFLCACAEGRQVFFFGIDAQLLLDGLELVVEVVFTLLLVDFRLDLLLEVVLDLEQVDVLVEQFEQLERTLLQVVDVQQGHLVRWRVDLGA